MVLEASMRAIARSMAAHLLAAFDTAIEGMVIEGVREEHPQQFTLEFTLYQYVECRFNYDQGHSGFSVQGVGVQFPLTLRPTDEEILDLCANPHVIERLDAAVRLRIPERYLEAEPWKQQWDYLDGAGR